MNSDLAANSADLVANFIQAANQFAETHGTDQEDSLRADLIAAEQLVYNAGPSTRLNALLRCKEIQDAFTRICWAPHLVCGEPDRREGIETDALHSLSESDQESDWELLVHIAGALSRGAPRPNLRRALVTASRKAQGVLRRDLEYTLRRNGFRRVLGIWI